ncbi:nuclease-related domain-containing protein [Metabacillus sp. 84]|uniref:nuclease-related domain-containing protein n=1 Tax=Metabacillus sp. 84 TaxID=3404705 RepID=UPI003CE92911
MIVKPLEVPLALKQLQALKRRLPSGHPKTESIKKALAARTAGYVGERALVYPLSFINNDFKIFHDVRLFDGQHYFQIDVLIVTKAFIVILEVKNIAGTLYFDSEFSQLIRIQNDVKEPFPDPLIQIKRQEMQFSTWLKKFDFPDLPIKTFIIIANPRTILQTSSKNSSIHQKVLHSSIIPFKMNELENVLNQKILTTDQVNELVARLANEHALSQTDMLKRFEIKREDVLPGVYCSACCNLTMKKAFKSLWTCSICSHTMENAHHPALEDYALLFQKTITNREARFFLDIPSSSIVKKLFNQMNMKPVGHSKLSFYRINV